MSNTYLSEGNQIVFKEKIKGILTDFMTDYDEDKWSNEDVYEKYSNKLLEQFNTTIADLEAKLAESEEKKESYRLQNDEHHLQLLQFYSRLGVEAFGADIHEKALETLMIMKEQLVEFKKVIEKYDCKSVKKLNGRLYRYDQYETKIFNMEEEIKGLKQQLADKNQDKISFAVEKLTEIRDYVKNCWSLDTTEGKVRLDISKKIRLKIEALTHQHEDKGE